MAVHHEQPPTNHEMLSGPPAVTPVSSLVPRARRSVWRVRSAPQTAAFERDSQTRSSGRTSLWAAPTPRTRRCRWRPGKNRNPKSSTSSSSDVPASTSDRPRWWCAPASLMAKGSGSRNATFGTTTPDLLALSDWLDKLGVTHVAMESTGYWKPIFYILENDFDVILVNARHIKHVPGRKTDTIDAAGSPALSRGLLRPSYVPPQPIRSCVTSPATEKRSQGADLGGQPHPQDPRRRRQALLGGERRHGRLDGHERPLSRGWPIPRGSSPGQARR